MTREKILQEAKKCVCGEREQDYGSPERNFALIAAFWEVYLKKCCVAPGAECTVNPEDVAAMMALLKIARIASWHGGEDSWVDLAGYAACGGELATENGLVG